MPRKRKNELVACTHFAWKLYRRNGTWHADGRSNTVNVGRHSLGTTDRTEAVQRLSQLDSVAAADQGLIPRSQVNQAPARTLSLAQGRKLYEDHIKRPRVAGGVRASTQKKYRSVFDKFLKFAATVNITDWNAVTIDTLHNYVADLEKKGYAGKTLRNELVTLIQTQKWFLQEKHLVGVEPLRLRLRKVESERAYCYTIEQVEAMQEVCDKSEELKWLKDVIVALACTGLRIAELASLRWLDIDMTETKELLSLTDESGRSATRNGKRRELKSGRSRFLPIHPDLVKVLAKMTRIDQFVFHGPRGGRLKPDTVRNVLIREVIKPLAPRFPSNDGDQGFKDGRLHSFRHYFASMCGNRGVSERVVMEWLGHSDSEMVRHYYHLHDDESRQQMNRLNPLNFAGNRPTGISNRAVATKPTETTDLGEPVDKAT